LDLVIAVSLLLVEAIHQTYELSLGFLESVKWKHSDADELRIEWIRQVVAQASHFKPDPPIIFDFTEDQLL
jgi:hypothetical protein